MAISASINPHMPTATSTTENANIGSKASQEIESTETCTHTVAKKFFSAAQDQTIQERDYINVRDPLTDEEIAFCTALLAQELTNFFLNFFCTAAILNLLTLDSVHPSLIKTSV